MLISRTKAGIATALLAAAGVMAVPASATTATTTPSLPTTIRTNPGVTSLLLANGVSLGTSGAASTQVFGAAATPQFSVSFKSVHVAGTATLTHTGGISFVHGTHVVTATNLVVTVYVANKAAAVNVTLNGTAGVRAFTVKNIVFTKKVINGHTWTVATGPLYIASTTAVTTLTTLLGLSAPIFNTTTPIATATAYVY